MTTDARQQFEHSEKTASCPTCGSDKREVKFTSHFSGMPILECSDPWHGCDSAKESAEPPLDPGEFYITRGDGVQERCRYVGQSITIPAESAEPSKPAAQESMNAREPHDGWMNTWLYTNIPRDQNCAYMWNPEVRKMAGDWAEFIASERVAQLEKQHEMDAHDWDDDLTGMQIRAEAAEKQVEGLQTRIASLQKQNEELRYYSQNLDKYLKEQNDKIMAESAAQKQVEGLRAAPRWRFFVADQYRPAGMSPREDGEWVKWADVEAALATQLPTEKKV